MKVPLSYFVRLVHSMPAPNTISLIEFQSSPGADHGPGQFCHSNKAHARYKIPPSSGDTSLDGQPFVVILSTSAGTGFRDQQVYDMYPAFWTNDPFNYDQGSHRFFPQFYPHDIRIPFRQSKTINSHIQLRIASPSPLEAVQEEVVSPKAAIVIDPLPTNRRFAPCHTVSDGELELVGPMYVQL